MKKIKVITETGFVNCIHADEFEVKDCTTKEEIEEIFQDILCNRIWTYWVEAKE